MKPDNLGWNPGGENVGAVEARNWIFGGYLGYEDRNPDRAAALRVVRNVEKNAFRDDIMWIGEDLEPHPMAAALVGAGPSFNPEHLHDARWDQLIAVGKPAAEKLAKAGLEIDGIILTNPDVKRLPKARYYFLASQCDPFLFEKHKADVVGFNAQIAGLGYYMPNGGRGIAGGDTAGRTAIMVLLSLGYRNISLFGFDSSMAFGPQRINVGPRTFYTDRKLADQARSMPASLMWLREARGCDVKLYGDGLMQTITALPGIDDTPPDLGYYHLSLKPANWDFFTWLICMQVRMRRAGHPGPFRVVFSDRASIAVNNDTMSTYNRELIFDNVIRPLLKLYDAIEVEDQGYYKSAFANYRIIAEAFKNGEPVPKVKVPVMNVEAPGCPISRITITLREAEHQPNRNSNLTSWLEFARRRQAEGYDIVFVRDTAKADEPLDGFATYPAASKNVLVRTALYAASFCCLSISNGPVTIPWFSDIPFINFIPLGLVPGYPPCMVSWWEQHCGITPPFEQMPWFGPHQVIDWGPDTLENIERAWAGWIKVNGGALHETAPDRSAA